MDSPDLRWTTRGDAVLLICRGRTAPHVWRIALVVGALLTVVNQGAVILSGQVDAGTLARIAANVVIPYTVSSLGLLRAFRQDAAPAAAARGDVTP